MDPFILETAQDGVDTYPARSRKCIYSTLGSLKKIVWMGLTNVSVLSESCYPGMSIFGTSLVDAVAY